MKIRFMTSVITAVSLLLLAGPGQAAEPKYQDGVHFTTIDNAPATVPGKVEVVEAFSYLCTHCATFEPYIQSWLKRKPESVKFVRYPVVFGRSTWELYARAYVTADIMGIADQSHGPLMDKIWKEREVLKSIEELADFYAAFGAKPDVFIATSQSFAVDAKMRRDQRFLMESGVNSTPNLVINGKYLVSGNAAVANYDQFLAVTDYLIAEELLTMAVEEDVEAAVEGQEAADTEALEAAAAATVTEES
jgi:thiol:disulfide interchange protein DsbA